MSVEIDILEKRLQGETWYLKVAIENYRYEVTADEELRVKMGAKSITELVEAAFKFLLDREPASSIIRKFDLYDISRFFSDFEEKLRDYLPKGD